MNNSGKDPVDMQINLLGISGLSTTAGMNGDPPAPTGDPQDPAGISGTRIRWPVQFQISQTGLINHALSNYIADHLKHAQQPQNTPDICTFDVQGSFILGGAPGSNWQTGAEEDPPRLTRALHLNPGSTDRLRAAIIFHTQSPIISVDGESCRFAYTDPFPDPSGLLDSAFSAQEYLLAFSHKTLNPISRPVPSATGRLQHLCLQSFLGCTWSLRHSDGRIRYSEWEGFPLFHSTMDVVYNTCLFHLAFCPDTLADMLDHWPRYSTGGHMPHDMGKGLIIGRNQYPVAMPVEEDCNYLLLNAMYYSRTKDARIIRQHRDAIHRTILALLASDSDGNSLPDTGTINTFDDAPPSINSAPNQLYLGIKTASALQLSADVMGTFLDPDLVRRSRQASQSIFDTVQSSWLGNHFPIALAPPAPEQSDGAEQETPKRMEALVLPYDGKKSMKTLNTDSDNLDGYSNYIAHGLIPLWICGSSAPAELENRLKIHLVNAHAATATPYGDGHRDGESNVWVSQNMWRDLAARYLSADIDLAGQHRKYWQLQCESVHRRDGTGRWEGFCDSPLNSFLTAYSRGIPILALSWFDAGTVALPPLPAVSPNRDGSVNE